MEYEEMTFDMFANNEMEQEKGSAQDNFGCCSKYRQCSIEGKCVQADEYSKNCTYRKNLEQGKIFYSKKSPKFNQNKYDYIDNWFKALPNDKQEAFGEIVSAFVHLRRGATHILCGSLSDLPSFKDANNFNLVYDCIDECDIFSAASPEELVSFILSNEAISFYSFDYFNARYSQSDFKTSSIKFPMDLEFVDSDYFGDDKTEANLTEEGKTKKKKRKQYQKKCWKEYLINDNHEVLNKFSEYFAYISVSPNFLFELDEWASDNWKLLPLKLDDFKFLFVERKNENNKINAKDNLEDKSISFDFKKMKSVDWKNK